MHGRSDKERRIRRTSTAMIYTLNSFEDLQNINVCLIYGNMKCYTEAPGQTSLLKISEIVVNPNGPYPTLLSHYLVAHKLTPTISSAQKWGRPPAS